MKWVAQVKSVGGETPTGIKVGDVFDAEISHMDSFYTTLPGNNRVLCLKNGCMHLRCGEWDLYQVPESEEEYSAKLKECDIKAGDTVRIKRGFQSNLGCCGLDFHPKKTNHIGKEGIVSYKGEWSMSVSGWSWPYFCLEKVETEKPDSMRPRELHKHMVYNGWTVNTGVENTKKEPQKKESKMKLTKNWWKKYKLVCVVAFSAYWMPVACRVAYPLLVRIGAAVDSWLLARGIGNQAAPEAIHAVVAAILVILAIAAIYAAKKALQALYKVM